MNVWLAVLAYYDTVNATTGTLYFTSGRGFTTGSGSTPPNVTFDPRIKQAAKIRRDMYAGGTTRGRSAYAVGELVLGNTDGELDGLLNYAFDGRAITEYYGPEGGTFPGDFTTVLVATMQQADFTESEIRIQLRDRQAEIDVPLQTTKYAGTNTLPAGLEGTEDLKGKPKPYLLGDVFNVPAVCVNTSKLIYQVNDGAVQEIVEVRDMGVPLSYTPASWDALTSGTANDLWDLATDGDGTWVVVGSSGTVRFSTNDGTSWSAATTSFGATRIESVCWDPVIAKFVLGGDAIMYYSTDGDTWTACTEPLASPQTPQRIVSNGAGTMVAFVNDPGGTQFILSSTDGITFTSRTHGFTGSLVTGCWGRNQFVALKSNRIETSPDGVTWTLLTSKTPGSGQLEYGNGLYVLNGTTIYTSEDLLSWTARHTFVASTTAGRVKFGGAKQQFMAIGGTPTTGYEHEVAYSGDGILWETAASVLGTSVAGYGVGMDPTSGSIVICGAGGTLAEPNAGGTYANTTDLQDDDLQPEPGAVKTYNAGGYFRLGSRPAGLVTVDVKQGAAASNRTAGQLFAAVMTKIGKSADYSTSDVTAIDAARTDVLGFWSGTEEHKAADVLDMIAGSVGAWWGADQTGVYRIAVGPDTSGTSQLAVYHQDMIGGLRRLPTNDAGGGLPIYRFKVRYRRNYAVQAEVAGNVTTANANLYAQDYREEIATTSSVQTAYLLAREESADTLLATAADASSYATRRVATYDSRQDRVEITMQLNTETMAIDMGEVLTIYHPRFGLSAGAAFAVMTIEPDAERGRVTFGCWRAV